MIDFRRMRQIIDEELPKVAFAIEKAKSEAEKCTSAWNDMPKGGTKDNQIERNVDVRIMLAEEEKKVIDELDKMRADIRPAIDSLEDGNERRVMRARYMCGRGNSITETSAMFGYSIRHTQRILQDAETHVKQNDARCRAMTPDVAP